MIQYTPTLLHVTAVLHFGVGAWLFREPLGAILRDGYVGAVDLDPLRGLAFWFLILSPMLVIVGLLVSRALETGDTRILAIVGWGLLGIGVVGAAGMPVSGFWILIALSVPLLMEVYGGAPAHS